MTYVLPVMNVLSSEAKNKVKAAISLDSPKRFKGMACSNPDFTASGFSGEASPSYSASCGYAQVTDV